MNEAQLKRGLNLWQNALEYRDARIDLSPADKVSKFFDCATDQEINDFLVTGRSMGIVSNDEVNERFNSYMIADRLKHKDIQNRTWIEFLEFTPVTHSLAD
jgi:hypothetical protein